MKAVEGEVTVPATKLAFTVGEGRGMIRYSVRITAERKDDGFAVILRVERISAADIAGLVFTVLLFSYWVWGKAPEALPFVLPFFLIFLGVRVVHAWRNTPAVTEAFTVPYLALPRVTADTTHKHD